MLLRKKDCERESGSQKVRALRALCWGGLICVQLLVLHCLDTKAETETLHVIPEKEIRVERDVVFEAVEGMSEIPEQMSFTVEEEGRTADAVCYQERKTVVREWWSPDFSFPVTFYGCDTGFFQLSDVMIPYDEEKPQTTGYEDRLLEQIGASPEEYRILDVSWDGDLYRSQDGDVCRNAVASGEKLLRDYRVHYSGKAVLPQIETALETEQSEEIQSAENPDFQDGSEIETAGESQAETGLDSEEERWKRIIRTVTLALSLFLLIGMIVLIILVKRKKMKYTDKQETNVTSGGKRDDSFY